MDLLRLIYKKLFRLWACYFEEVISWRVRKCR